MAWVTFLAGGVYAWVWVPAAIAMLALTLVVRPPIAINANDRRIDLALVLALAACLVQLIPVPSGMVAGAAPHAVELRRSLWLPPLPMTPSLWIPLTIVPSDTLAALGIGAFGVLVFWTTRALCESGSQGRLIRAIAFIGLAGSIAAIVQRSQRIDLLYGFWKPLDSGARPYGPFVNRNHLATWIIMAAPLVFGYVLARAPRREHARPWSQRIADALQQLGTVRIWLTVSVCVMTLAVLLSASRSGIIGLLVALAVSAALSRGRGDLASRRWTALQLVLLAIVALSFANYDALLRRAEESVARAQQGRGRTAVWRDTFRVLEDFPLTGTGAGTYGTAINAYQTAEPGYLIGQAHNHYLQLAAEGGMLLVVPAVLALGAFCISLRRALKHDATPNYLVRTGATAGISGVMVQNIWETGLTMPANAMLLAIVAAIATHRTMRQD